MNLSNSKLIERVVLSVTTGTIFLVGTTVVFNFSKSLGNIADNSKGTETNTNTGNTTAPNSSGNFNIGGHVDTQVHGDYHGEQIDTENINPTDNRQYTTSNTTDNRRNTTSTRVNNHQDYSTNCNGNITGGVCSVGRDSSINNYNKTNH
ncbi:hypothetical protein [uncultured Nostoc sp.]|uniref:hypothetical protein n=1 Tax=uncultured Nostoc sp. TaxID=340711 RepID=UPI0035CC2579